MTKRKVAIFTGNRAEYGLQSPLIKAISSHPDLDYFLLISGAHLEEEFGFTKEEIDRDGFKVYEEIKISMPEDSLHGTVYAIGAGIVAISKVLAKINPDFLLVYADRFEGFSAVIAASQMAIPTAHVEGGDVTEGGALDDSVRHAMTKLSHLHFATNEDSVNRILKLGEESWRVFNIGLPAIDFIREGNFASHAEISEKYRLDTKKPVVLFTQHSVSTEFQLASRQIEPSLQALRELSLDDIQIVVTYPNNDAGGKLIISKLREFSKEDNRNIQVCKSLGRYYFHGMLNVCGRGGMGVCLGNSSSGIKEAPVFGCPSVNIGTRQNGRLRSSNVIDVTYDKEEIIAAIKTSLFDEKYRKTCSECDNPYGIGNSGLELANTLATIEFSKDLIKKKITY